MNKYRPRWMLGLPDLGARILDVFGDALDLLPLNRLAAYRFAASWRGGVTFARRSTSTAVGTQPVAVRVPPEIDITYPTR